ncbi:MAG: NUDIX domain-containing protein [Propionibacteriales bacterium]|nr:NUDIX domain-containing protein [Propionibacteriales bacterium]
MAKPRVAAGALFLDEDGRVLLVHPDYKPTWDIPGGYVEPNETPLEACRREVQEELGIKPPIGRLLVADWAPSPSEGDKILFIFDGGILDADEQARIQLEGELTEYAFYDPDDLDEPLIPRLSRRVRQALDSRDRRIMTYLEHGERQG